MPLPDGLPAPVERYYRQTYGDEVPVVHSVVITGRGKIRPFGLWLPARYRFTHDAGKGYRHYIEATWFGIPIMKVNERYIDLKAKMELPWMTDEGEKLDQAANIGMWAELAGSAPSVLVTDPRVRWEPIDDDSAVLVVPLGTDATDTFVVRFDPGTGGHRLARGDALQGLEERREDPLDRRPRGRRDGRACERPGDRHRDLARPGQSRGRTSRPRTSASTST